MNIKKIKDYIEKIKLPVRIKLPGRIKPLYLYLIAAGVLVTVTAIIIIVAGNKNHVEFFPYTSNQGGFTVDAPGGEMQTTTGQMIFFDKNVLQFTHEASLPGAEFRVIHFDLPAGMINPQKRSKILNNLATNFIQPVNGVITNSLEYSLLNYDGIRISAKGEVNDTAMVSEAIILLVSNRIYLAGVHGKEKSVRKIDVDRFIGSFRFNF